LKPNKDKIYPENYRGITVTNTFSTVIEGILKERIEPKLLLSQNKLVIFASSDHILLFENSVLYSTELGKGE
jgi:hypothetical protein